MDQKHPSQVAFLIMNPVCMSPRLHLSIINSPPHRPREHRASWRQVFGNLVREHDSWFSKILKHYNANPLLIWYSELAFTSSRHMFLHTLDPLVQFLPAVLPDPCSRMYRLFLFHSLQVLFWDLQGGCLRMYRLFLFDPLRVLWRSCYPQLPPTGHRLLAASLLIYTFWLDLTMEREQILAIMLILFWSSIND